MYYMYIKKRMQINSILKIHFSKYRKFKIM